MTTLCTHCGKPLPRADARFCNNCGSFVGSQSNEGGVVQNGNSAGTGRTWQSEQRARPVLREQVAFPPQRFTASGVADTAQPPAWMDRLEQQLHTSPTPHDLRVKEWDASSSMIDEDTREDGSGGQEIDELPTREHAVSGVSGKSEVNAVDAVDTVSAVSGISDVEDLPTSRLAVPPTSNSVQVEEDDAPGIEQLETRPVQTLQPGQPTNARPFMQPAPVTPAIPVSQPGFAPMPVAAPTGSAPAPTVSPAPMSTTAQPAWRGRPVRLLVVAAALVLLLIAGFVVWVVKFQPFAVPGITDTTVAYTSSSLGFSLSYPQGWTAQEDAQHSTASFFDANHTDQFNVALASPDGQTIAQYSKKLTAQLGLTGQKSLSPISFAGASWQGVQGTILQKGASYTATILVTMHGSHLYALTQMAPASTFADAERLFFAPARASFHFL